MIENKTTQLIYRTVYCVIAAFGALLSLGIFTPPNNRLDVSFYAYYTNLSNYLCLGVMCAVLHRTRKALKNGDKRVCGPKLQLLKYLCAVWIMVTCLVYNIMLGNPFSVKYWTSFTNLIMHLVAPLMFIVDWFLFDPHFQIKAWHPVLALVLPYMYVVFIIIRSFCLPHDGSVTVYPYFFMDVDEIGYGGLMMWVAILTAAFLALSYLLWLYDKLGKKNGKWRLILPKMQRKKAAEIVMPADTADAEAAAVEDKPAADETEHGTEVETARQQEPRV